MPADINIDFEAGMIGALGQVYPIFSVHGCLFHLSKNVFKHVLQLGLQQMYLNDDIFRKNIRMIHPHLVLSQYRTRLLPSIVYLNIVEMLNKQF